MAPMRCADAYRKCVFGRTGRSRASHRASATAEESESASASASDVDHACHRACRRAYHRVCPRVCHRAYRRACHRACHRACRHVCPRVCRHATWQAAMQKRVLRVWLWSGKYLSGLFGSAFSLSFRLLACGSAAAVHEYGEYRVGFDPSVSTASTV
jgi:hypothetical protein